MGRVIWIKVFLFLVFALINSTTTTVSAETKTPFDANAFIRLIKNSKSGVAHIFTKQKFFDPFRGTTGLRDTMGSGMLVNHFGEIKVLTNRHVVKGAIEIQVTLSTEQGKRKIDGEVDSEDTYTDLALIKLKTNESGFLGSPHTLLLGNSDSVQAGEWILAIGSPFGLEFSAQKGIISAVGRPVNEELDVPPHDFLQIDADINPGNSGGPLLNLDGEVIGVVTAIFSRTGFSAGIGFAIPINIAKDFLEKRSLGKKEAGGAGWIGIVTQAAEEYLLEQFQHPKNAQGIIIGGINKSSPAASAGIRQGDMLISLQYNGVTKKIASPAEFERVVSGIKPGSPIVLTILRKGEQRNVSLIVSVRPTKPSQGSDKN